MVVSIVHYMWSICHWLESTSSNSYILKDSCMHNVSMCTGRMEESIIHHWLSGGFSLELSGSSLFPSSGPFTAPHWSLQQEVCHWTEMWHKSLFSPLLKTSTFVCAASNNCPHLDTSDVAQRPTEKSQRCGNTAEETEDSQITSNKDNII